MTNLKTKISSNGTKTVSFKIDANTYKVEFAAIDTLFVFKNSKCEAALDPKTFVASNSERDQVIKALIS